MGPEGEHFTMTGPVWAPIPQTPQSAEHCAYAAALQLADEHAIIVSDCKRVVAAAALPLSKRLSPNRFHAGMLRSALACDLKGCIKAIWTKAHVLDSMDPADRAALSATV